MLAIQSAEPNCAYSATADEWFTTPEAAQHLRVSTQWLEKLRSWGGGPDFHRLGRRVLYRRSALDNWAAARVYSSTSDQGRAA